MRRIIFRSDGNTDIGLGHIYRSLALVKMLHKNFDCVFASAAPPAFLAGELKKIAVPLTVLDKVAYPPINARTTQEEIVFDMGQLLTGNETVVLDGYWFGSSFQRAIKAKGCQLVCIDDLHEGIYHADLIVNQSPGITPAHYSAQPFTKFALGLGYAMLRPSFLQAAASGQQNKSGSSTFICFGGADPLQLTRRSLEIASRQTVYDEIFCVTSVKDDGGCTAVAAKDSRVKLLYQLNEQQMCEVMTHCKYGVVPSSALLIEAISCGIIPVTCYYTQNQQDFHNAMVAAGIHSVGFVDEGFDENLSALLQQMNDTHSAAVTGLMKTISASKENFIEQFKKL